MTGIYRKPFPGHSIHLKVSIKARPESLGLDGFDGLPIDNFGLDQLFIVLAGGQLPTVIAMRGFVGYYSAEHFANSLGWPITLVLMGLAFLGVGAIALKVKRRI